MQGFILRVTKVKDEDLIVNILTQSHLYTLYRFYGARHSTINLGYKIDFEIEYQTGYLPKLRHITHLGFPWLRDLQKHMLWQRFIRLLYDHLREFEEVDSFYFGMLERLAKKLTRQEPRRAFIEEYVRLLEFEGRLHSDMHCFICDLKVQNPTLARAFLPAHTHCVPKEPFDDKKLLYLFRYKDTQFFDEEEIERLWQTLQEGF